MSYAVRSLKFEGEVIEYHVTLWVGAEGLSVTVSEDDPCGMSVDDLPLSDMLIVGRKVRRLAKWAETPPGKKRISKLFDKDAALDARPSPREESK